MFELVQFKDGQFGARKTEKVRGLIFSKTKYVYLSIDVPYITTWSDTWSDPECVHEYCKGTKEQALESIRLYQARLALQLERDRLSAIELAEKLKRLKELKKDRGTPV